jgi:heme exporter protein C
MKNLYKIIAVLLILWSLLAGLLVPLKTGIYSAEPTSLKAGQKATIAVIGYNSFFLKNKEKLRAWLKYDNENAISAQKIDVLNDQQLSIAFDLPTHFPGNNAVAPLTLVIDDLEKGPSILPDAVTISQDSVAATSNAAWSAGKILATSFQKDFTYPYRNILSETIRNTYYHVPLWFAMMILFTASAILSIRYLATNRTKFDQQAVALTDAGVVFGLLGLVTGAIWAKYTWGAYWSFDVKQNMSAVAMLIYLAYFVLRQSFDDEEKRARIAAVYNIFAFATLIPLLFVIPRMVDSLHPGNGGNPALGSNDLDNTMRLVFWPAIIGWTLFGVWMAEVFSRFLRVRERVLEVADFSSEKK